MAKLHNLHKLFRLNINLRFLFCLQTNNSQILKCEIKKIQKMKVIVRRIYHQI